MNDIKLNATVILQINGRKLGSEPAEPSMLVAVKSTASISVTSMLRTIDQSAKMNSIAGSNSVKQQVDLQVLYNELKELREKVAQEEARSPEERRDKVRPK